MKHRNRLVILTMIMLVLVLSGCSKATSTGGKKSAFPDKTLTAICPWSAGGGTDTVLRGLTKETEEFLGQTITVTNQTGGGGAIGHTAIKNAKNDGYTVGMITFELSSLPAQGIIDYTHEDFSLLMRVNMESAAITVPADAPYETIHDFIEYAKAHPGEVKVGNSGIGATWHVAAGLFEQVTEVELGHVPFDGAAPAVTALIGGHIDAVAVSASEVQAQVEAEELKILAIMDEERSKVFTDVPTMYEEGYDVVFGTWRGLAVPKDTPQDVVDVLSDAFKKGIESDGFKDYAEKTGLNIAYQNAEDFREFLAKNSLDVAKVLKGLGLSAE
ncbi:tripartite tricarboxylate transporter substrate binding protein [Vallitalea pronyensis]|uniref:Tripartite tricarboxylate transporter substrate binding protein n=1 Tax=Vallitalea pronyensis TaxID=1348613 RepID=A0A8J8MK60_9FIRM|nr:tripartite tricarboxylate transporter substrate binding protein [Vallitalea pronyensis]QUI23184.1 tripartite tricarboxylate transporter substrate binding protein [Vallitalea pronyensis]